MRPTHPTPLYPVSLALASGCVVALATQCSEVVAGTLFFISLLVWLCFRLRSERNDFSGQISLTVFLIFIACAGLFHTTISSHQISGDDIRKVPDFVLKDSQTAWLAMVIDEPVTTLSTTRMGKTHQSFTLKLKAWREGDFENFQSTQAVSKPNEIVPWHTVTGTVLCRMVLPLAPIRLGDELVLKGQATSIESPLTPGEIDTRAMLARSNIYFRLEAPKSVQVIKTGQESLQEWISIMARDWVYARLRSGIEDDPEVADTLTGMLIGYRQSLPLNVEDDFRRTGTLHVFAVSGQNVSEIAAMGIVFLSLTALVPWRWSWTVAPFLILFCLLTGSQASAVRATVMALVILLGWWLGRPVHAKGLWSIALILMLVWDPSVLTDPGAQLSFGVVWGLIFLSPPIAAYFEKWFQTDPFVPRRLLPTSARWEHRSWIFLVRAVSASIAATLLSEPIAAVQFHQVTPISVVANLVVVPLAGLVTSIGTVGVAVSAVVPVMGEWVNNTNWLAARILLIVVHGFASIPGSSLNVPDLQVAREPTPTVTIFPLQSSAGMLIRLPNQQAWLFNSGRDSDARYITSHLCQYFGINRLSGFVLTEVNTAANGGEEQIETLFRPGRMILPELKTRSHVQKELTNEMVSLSIPSEKWKAGDQIHLDSGTELDVLWPLPEDNDSSFSHAQDRSLIFKLTVGPRSILWVGNAGPAVRNRLLELYPGLHADVVVLSTAQDPTQEESEFVDRVRGSWWIHFHQDTYDLHVAGDHQLYQAARTYWPLDQSGTITLSIDSNGKSRIWPLPEKSPF